MAGFLENTSKNRQISLFDRVETAKYALWFLFELLQKCSITLKELEGNGTKESLAESENGHFEEKIEGELKCQ